MLIFLLIFLLVSNALTTRRDKSILFSRIVIKALLMISFLAFNNMYLTPLNHGVPIFGGILNLTIFTQTMSILLLSAVILTLTAFDYIRLYWDKYCLALMGGFLSFSLKYPLHFFTNELEIPLLYILLTGTISILVGTFISLLSRNKLLVSIEIFFTFITGLIVGVLYYHIREYDILGAISVLFADFLPIGMCLMYQGPGNGNISTSRTSGITLSSNQGSNNTTGSVSSSNPVPSGSGSSSNPVPSGSGSSSNPPASVSGSVSTTGSGNPTSNEGNNSVTPPWSNYGFVWGNTTSNGVPYTTVDPDRIQRVTENRNQKRLIFHCLTELKEWNDKTGSNNVVGGTPSRYGSHVLLPLPAFPSVDPNDTVALENSRYMVTDRLNYYKSREEIAVMNHCLEVNRFYYYNSRGRDAPQWIVRRLETQARIINDARERIKIEERLLRGLEKELLSESKEKDNNK